MFFAFYLPDNILSDALKKILAKKYGNQESKNKVHVMESTHLPAKT